MREANGLVVTQVEKRLKNKAAQKETCNHTHKETSDQSFEDASKASSHFGEMIRIILVVIRFITRTTITTLVLCIRRIHTMVITIIVSIDPTITIII